MVEENGKIAKQNEEGKPINFVAFVSCTISNKNFTFMISNYALNLTFFMVTNNRNFYLTRKPLLANLMESSSARDALVVVVAPSITSIYIFSDTATPALPRRIISWGGQATRHYEIDFKKTKKLIASLLTVFQRHFNF